MSPSRLYESLPSSYSNTIINSNTIIRLWRPSLSEWNTIVSHLNYIPVAELFLCAASYFCPLSSPALLSKTFEIPKMSSNSFNNPNFNLSYEDALDLGLSQGHRLHSNQSTSLHSTSSSQPSGTQSSVSTNSSQNQQPNNLHPATYNSYLSAPTQNSCFHPNGGFHPTQRFLSHQGIQYPVPLSIHHPPSQGSSCYLVNCEL